MDFLKKGKCCACEQPMADSPNINMVGLGLKPKWEYPIHGSILTDDPPCAVAIMCDDCVDVFNDPIFAVEFRDEEIIYHRCDTLQRVYSKEEIADRADAHSCWKNTFSDDDSNLRCSECDRILRTADSEFRYD